MNNIKVGNIEAEHNNYTINGECSNCGACCSNTLPMTKQDVAKVRKYIRKHNIKPINHVPGMMVERYVDAICPFRDNVNECCTIYEARPSVCRMYKCDKTLVDIVRDVKNGLFDTKAKAYDVRSTFYGDGTMSMASVMTMIQGDRQFKREYKKCKDDFWGVLQNEQGKGNATA